MKKLRDMKIKRDDKFAIVLLLLWFIIHLWRR
jgi:hypothetical protein